MPGKRNKRVKGCIERKRMRKGDKEADQAEREKEQRCTERRVRGKERCVASEEQGEGAKE